MKRIIFLIVFLFPSSLFAQEYIVIQQPKIIMIYPEYLAPRPCQFFRNIAKRQIRKELYYQAVLDYRWREYHKRLHND